MEVSELSGPDIDLLELCDSNPELANDLVSNVNKYLFIHKKRLLGVPNCLTLDGLLSSLHINKMVKVSGAVIKTYPIFFKNVISEQLCLKCNDTIYLSEQEIKSAKNLNICHSCGSQNLKISQNFLESFPIQNIRIQDMSNSSSMSETVEICIEGEKAGQFLPGDKISVTGVVLRRWKQLRVNEPMLSTLYLKAFQIVKDCDEEYQIREIKSLIDEFTAKTRFERRKFLIKSFCPEIFGLAHVKLGLLVSILGDTVDNKDNSKTRANSHVLLTGDPGTGKSHLLKAISKLVTPSIFTNGIGTSDAGLTSCAVRQGKEWTLEAGALVLADTGICVIDEFHRLKVNEKGGLLESMEQQSLSIAKAGMVTSLNSRCSVIAAASTRYDYDFRRSICDNLGIASPLVSRFDLIFGIFDKKRNKDSQLSEVILSRDCTVKSPENIRWSQSSLKTYISQCRKKKNKIDEQNCQVLLKYYTKKRAIEGVNEYNTIRMLESLVRLTESHSKLMNDDTVTDDDSYIAIILMESCINSCNNFKFDVEKVFEDENYLESVKKRIQEEFTI